MKDLVLFLVLFYPLLSSGSAEMWHLKNTGFQFQREVSDIENRWYQSRPGVDLDLPDMNQVSLKKTPVVAIIDYGIDTSHPQLKSQFYLNEAECVNGEAPLSPTQDKDGNGLVGDCKGWNFTAAAGREARVVDDSGHGTHLAGIIAAESNELGFRGIDSRIKILPLQVLRKSQSTRDLGLKPEWVAQAVRYAISREVDVINFSLGWPEFMNTDDVKRSLEEAVNAGIVIVAAAGNNSHDVPLFPCAFSEVLCVGAISPDGKISPFSNRGLHVDVLAPGEQILGTFPLNKEPEFSSFHGYEMKSGTSQAAPMIAALAALLKAQDPSRSVKAVRNLILNGSRSVDGHFVDVAAGLVSFKNSLQSESLNQSWIRVKGSQLRKLDHAVVRVPAEIRFGEPGKRLEVRDEQGHYLSYTKTNDLHFEILFSIQSEELDQRQTLNFRILGTGADRSILQKSYSLKVMKGIGKPTAQYSVPQDLRSLTVAPSFKEEETGFSRQENQHFHFWRIEGDSKSDPELQLIRLAEGGRSEVKSLTLPAGRQILWIRERDLDVDTRREIEVLYVAEIEGKKEVRWLFLDSEGQGLFGSLDQSWFVVKTEEFLPDFEVTAVRAVQLKNREVLLPLFLKEARLPKLDAVTAFDPDQRRQRVRLLSYRFHEGQLVPASFDRMTELSALKLRLGLRSTDTVNILSVKDQGIVTLSIGRGFSRQLIELDLFESTDWSSANLVVLKTDFALDGFLRSGAQWIGQSSFKNWIWGWIDNKAWTGEKISTGSESESWIQILGSLGQHSSQTLFVQSTTQVHLFKKGLGSDLRHDTRPFEVTSFLADEVFGSQSFTVVGKRVSEEYLALYSDSSLMVGPQVSLLVEVDGKLRSPIKWSLEIPEGCRALNPRVLMGKLNFVFQCSENSGQEKSTKLFTYQIESED